MKPTRTPRARIASRPRGLAPVVDERREHDRHVAVDQLAAGADHLVPGARGERRRIGEVHARQVVEPRASAARRRA